MYHESKRSIKKSTYPIDSKMYRSKIFIKKIHTNVIENSLESF